MEPIDWAWGIYHSVKSDIFGHVYMGMAILHFIDASEFSNLPTLRQVVHLGCALLHILEFAYRPLARYPDLFLVLNVLLSTPVFVFTWFDCGTPSLSSRRDGLTAVSALGKS